ncbi:hypothetical protein Mal64_24900 [Pseudobythopirellula maris]|uniref:Peptidase C51 domain-containing protein n=1 Tax=Pseudobythopirellula maris TaxID=2527991 RepID=A0A5C5ZNH4_9BACT|nr:hypothetical protein [Pseudobythopirellula maris]TWT88999.1 hypothetical protein Mal64_24900 [Pseudobythopirellula maris]
MPPLRRVSWLTAAPILLLAATAGANDVLEVARSYPDGGGYDRSWKGSGSPDEIRHAGEVILPAAENGTFCCGYTLAVAMRVAEQRGLLVGKTPDQVRRFQKLWFGSTEEDREVLCAFAAKDLGVGREVPLKEAEPGDFVQLWRTSGSGHSVVFLDWARNDNGQIVGFRYRSSQGSTDGIADKTEYLADSPGRVSGVVRERTHACRLNAAPAGS